MKHLLWSVRGALSRFARHAVSTMHGLSSNRVISSRVGAVTLCALLLFSTSFTPIQAASTTTRQMQGPTIDGIEVMYVNVSRWVGKTLKPPTLAQLRDILNSYRTGDWRAVGEPTKGIDGQWWQKLSRPRYTLGGAGVLMPWRWQQVGNRQWEGCWLNVDGKADDFMNTVRAGKFDWCKAYK